MVELVIFLYNVAFILDPNRYLFTAASTKGKKSVKPNYFFIAQFRNSVIKRGPVIIKRNLIQATFDFEGSLSSMLITNRSRSTNKLVSAAFQPVNYS